MGFFDLNVPYDPSSAGKANRIKVATKVMELGYGGVAYNRTMKGVMSDHDRCSIPLLSLSSLLKVAPALASSVTLHRDLLGVPRSSPFRQYTRLTVCVNSISQAQALNSGNPILKSYDLVAVKPLNQTAFEDACQKSEVDIIAIDFSEKLPFRLKLPMVKAAISRGVYFEITYSRFIADIQVRGQMISNAKLLVDWTRGKNLLVSSGAASANEIRGPCDVANLLSLLGVSKERAKASISKNCRTLIANALRKKQFHKELIRVEPISSTRKDDDEELWSLDWDKWDLISSGTGDLHLEDMEKSPSATQQLPKTVKAIDFSSVIEAMPSHGFQVKDLIAETEVVSQTTRDGTSLLATHPVVEMYVETKETASEFYAPSCDISLEQERLSPEVPEEHSPVPETIDAKADSVRVDSTKEDDSMVEPSIPSLTFVNEDDSVHADHTKDEFPSLNEADAPAELSKTDVGSGEIFLAFDHLSPLHGESSAVNTMMRDVDSHNPLDDISLTNCQINEECRHPDSPIQDDNESNREDGLAFGDDGYSEMSDDLVFAKNKTAVRFDARSPTDACTTSGDVPLDEKAAGENQTNRGLLPDGPSAIPHDRTEVKNGTLPPVGDDFLSEQMIAMTDSSAINDKSSSEAVGMKTQNQRVDNLEPRNRILSSSISAGRTKLRKPLRAVPFPFKRHWNPLMKQRGRKHRRRV